MPISKKILDEVNNLEENNEFKKLLIDLLEKEDKGNHQNKKGFDKIINSFIEENNLLEKDVK